MAGSDPEAWLRPSPQAPPMDPPPGEAPTAAAAPVAPAAPVFIRDEDGHVYKAPPEKAERLLATDKYKQLTPDEIERHEVHKQEAKRGLLGDVEEAGTSALNQLFMGMPGAIQSHTDTPEEAHHRELVEQEHSTARFLGGAAGFGGSLLAGGAMFKGAEALGQGIGHLIAPAEQIASATLAAKLAAKAANFATQGAVLAAPQALVHAAFGDPKQAAETLMWGVGAGAALGPATELFHSATSAIGDGISDLLGSEAVQKFARKTDVGRTAKAFGAERSQLSNPEWTGAVTDYAHENGLIKPGMTRQQLGEAVDVHRKVIGARIGEVIDSLDEALGVGKAAPRTIETEAAAAAPAERVKRTGEELRQYLQDNQEAAAHLSSTGKLPDSAIYKTEEAAAPPISGTYSVKDRALVDKAIKPGDLGAAIHDALYTPDMLGPLHRSELAALKDVVDQANLLPKIIVDGTEVVPFREAQNFVSGLRRQYSPAITKALKDSGGTARVAPTPLDALKSASYEVANTALQKAATDFAVAADKPTLVGALQKAKLDYAKTVQLDKWAATLEAQEAGNRAVSLTDFLHMGSGVGSGIAHGIGAGVGALVAGAPGAVVGGALAKVPGIALDYVAKKWMENKGLVYLSALAHKAAKDGPEVFSAVMASEGAQRLEATMSTVGDTVRRMAIEGIKNTQARTQEQMAALLGSTNGLTPDQSYAKLGKRLNALASNPAALIAVASQLSAPYQESAPDVAEAYQMKLIQGIQYLHKALPKPTTPPAPFAPDFWQPTHADKLAFHDKAEILANPMRAMAHVEQGTLSDAHLDSLVNNYPSTYDRMKSEVLKFAAEHPEVKLPSAERQSVAKFLGAPLDPLTQPDSIRMLQATYAQTGQPPGAAPGERAPKGKIRDRVTASSAFGASLGPSPAGEQ